MEHEGRMARDEEFARWYRTYHPRIRALCNRILRDAAAAEDVAQEALLRAWTKHEEMREEDLGAWLAVVARNLCISAVRRDGRLVVTDEVPEKADFGADPAVEAGRRESRRNVQLALAKLGDRHRRVIYLSEVREVDYEEIGTELGLTAAGARSIAFRARRMLREHLAAVGEGFSGVLLGFRVRIRSFAHRSRTTAFGFEAGSGHFLNLAMSVVLVTGFALGGSFATTAPAHVGGSVLSSVPASAERAVAGSRPTVAAAPSSAEKPSKPFVQPPVKFGVDRGDPDDGTHPTGAIVLDPPGWPYLEVGGGVYEDGNESKPYNTAVQAVDAACDRSGLC